MDAISIRQSVELFHLLFLSFLGKKQDKRRFVLKGGCNLRFFFGSPRYSEDMDMDVTGIPLHVLQDTVGAILGSDPFRQGLRVHGIEIEHITEHKQSETTQRWKLGLFTSATERPVPTKVEFSRRGLSGSIALDSIAPVLLHSYGMPPVITAHYPAEVALLQKIGALASRSVTQARDIFDLHLLQSEERMAHVLPLLDGALLKSAQRNVMNLSYDDFKGQVLAYLEPGDQATYDSPETWEAIQLSLLELLERSE